ncbi:RpiB/LacA/LacB family sugar-phosphate isomerase [Candidatus Berkelbacteria bacterium]|nr:RpiB/LacA/LacB family sugar-phosphate isomerase [Candidatus Berkelbacteria bacterium]
MIYLGADHGGFKLKEALKAYLKSKAIAFEDAGVHSDKPSDYPDQAAVVAQKVMANPGSFGVLLCRNGQGICIAANKIKGVRAASAWSPELAASVRQHDDANILCIASDFTDEQIAKAMVDAFLKTPFESIERRVRRIEKLHQLEQ